MHFHLTEVSTNTKTGPIPVATISNESCPTSCPLLGAGCYAEHGPLRIHWDAVTKRQKGMEFEEFTKRVRKLPRHGLWRYGQAGDLPGKGDTIDPEQLIELARANQNRPVIVFTHKPPTENNLGALREAAALGFMVNLSADNMAEADEFSDLGESVVVVLPLEYARKTRGKEWDETISAYRERTKSLPKATPKHRRIAVCPATYTDTRCSECRICSNHQRNGVIVGFPVHGTKKLRIKTG
ncbi:MAG: hypothetical protein EOQ39_18510 [Mesorhizobium sp.]|uniref:DUF7227 family protein n=1 Tax=Mesorhizobium sp. TaxID=1871066 RepID=UPI000FE996B0|nr:hypothetical protein [Mesorhizobium sp.]RWB08834.1 MAG: hypothetical protein EOQ37_04835 [Mesorhizobium sp.]RWB13516.1 MAG: hypothetical protein EOQ39_18510 [Mesorhizobium sp.]